MCLQLPFNQIVSLAARGRKAREGAFFDPIARDLWDSLELHVDGVPTEEQMGRAFADTLAVDHLVSAWLHARPGLPILEIGACLSTRFARVPALESRYITVDEPAIANLRRELFEGEAESLWQLSASLEKTDWLERVLASKAPVCVVLEGVLSALHRDDAIAIVDNLAIHLSRGSQIIATFDDTGRVAPGPGKALQLSFEGHVATYPCLRTRKATSGMIVAEAT